MRNPHKDLKNISAAGIKKDTHQETERSARLVLDKAWTFYKEGNYEQACSFYQEAVRLSPFDANIRIALGRTYCDIKNYDLAMQAFNKAKEIDPTNVGSDLLVAWIYVQRGNSKKNLEILEALSNEQLNDSDHHLARGYLAFYRGDYSNALKYLQSATELDPDDISTMSVTAQSLLHLGRNGEARDICLHVIDELPQSSAAWELLGVAEGQSGNYAAAVAAYQVSLERNSRNLMLYRKLFWLELRLGRWRSAWRRIGQAIKEKAE